MVFVKWFGLVFFIEGAAPEHGVTGQWCFLVVRGVVVDPGADHPMLGCLTGQERPADSYVDGKPGAGHQYINGACHQRT